MYRSPVLAVAGCAALIFIGLGLVTVTPSLGTLGTVVTGVGIVLLMAYLIVVFRITWSGDQKRAWGPVRCGASTATSRRRSGSSGHRTHRGR
jgi:hypothetical protein